MPIHSSIFDARQLAEAKIANLVIAFDVARESQGRFAIESEIMWVDGQDAEVPAVAASWRKTLPQGFEVSVVGETISHLGLPGIARSR